MLTDILHEMQHHPLRFTITIIAATLLPWWYLAGAYSPLP
jgi:hypothetical protein